MQLKIKINTNKKYKLCPKCNRLYSFEHNYCSNEEELTELVEVEFI